MMCLWASNKKKIFLKIFFASLKSMKKGVGSIVGSGSISQMYESGDPYPHQNVMDPQECNTATKSDQDQDLEPDSHWF